MEGGSDGGDKRKVVPRSNSLFLTKAKSNDGVRKPAMVKRGSFLSQSPSKALDFQVGDNVINFGAGAQDKGGRNAPKVVAKRSKSFSAQAKNTIRRQSSAALGRQQGSSKGLINEAHKASQSHIEGLNLSKNPAASAALNINANVSAAPAFRPRSGSLGSANPINLNIGGESSSADTMGATNNNNPNTNNPKKRKESRFGLGRRRSSLSSVQSLVNQHRERLQSTRHGILHQPEELEKFEREIFYTPQAGNFVDADLKDKDFGGLGNTVQRQSAKVASSSERQAMTNRLLALKKHANRAHTTLDPINFYDVVETETESQTANIDFSDRLAGKVTESLAFQRFILFCIILNTVLTVLYTMPIFVEKYGRLIDMADSVMLTIFLMELRLKIKYQKEAFWYDNWNVADFCLIFISLIGILIRDIGARQAIGSQTISFLRMTRAFRTLRILGALPNLQLVVNTFLKSLLELTNILAMILLLIFVFAIVFVQLLSDLVPEFFGTLTSGMHSLFIIITQDGWVKIWYAIEDENKRSGQTMNPLIPIFFVIYILMGSWIFINIISGITVTNYQLYVEERKLMEKAKFHEIKSKATTDVMHEVKTIADADIKPRIWSQQTPLTSVTALGKMSVQKLENYLLVVSAMEENAKEYRKIKEKLDKHMHVLQQTNVMMELPTGVDTMGYEVDLMDGDALSMLQTAMQNPAIKDTMRRDSAAGGSSRLSLAFS